MGAGFRVFHGEAKCILAKTSGFIAEAGFTHSLTPARNCTFGCTYCYVPTMGIYGGLKPDDWKHWGQFTTFKANVAALLSKALRPDQVIYCSPLVDPYQPAEGAANAMPHILDAVYEHPPRVFVIQTRGPLILRDLKRLVQVSYRTTLRVSFSLTTDREEIRKLYEPHCAPFNERLDAIRTLREAGIGTYATLAPLLPCNPEALVREAAAVTDRDILGDPFHIRAVKTRGATTRDAAWRISEKHDFMAWLDPDVQAEMINRIRRAAAAFGRRFAVGPEGFGWLAKSEAT